MAQYIGKYCSTTIYSIITKNIWLLLASWFKKSYNFNSETLKNCLLGQIDLSTFMWKVTTCFLSWVDVDTKQFWLFQPGVVSKNLETSKKKLKQKYCMGR